MRSLRSKQSQTGLNSRDVFSDWGNVNPEFIFSATEVERGSGLDRADPEDRAYLVRLIDVLIDALEVSFERGLPRSDSLIWLDTDLGEGSIFRALSADIPTMLTFEFDVRDYLEAAIEEMTEVTRKFKPHVLLLPVLNAAQEMGQVSAPSNVSQIARSMSPIDKHIGIYDFANTFDVTVAWDIRKPRGEWPDPMLQSENALRIISLFQDANLDPRFWVMNLPSVRVVAETLSARAQIDDRNDVAACFTLDTIFPLALGEQIESDALPNVVKSSTSTIAEMPGNAKVVIGAETYAACLRDHIRGVADAATTAEGIASRLMTIWETLRSERVSV